MVETIFATVIVGILAASLVGVAAYQFGKVNGIREGEQRTTVATLAEFARQSQRAALADKHQDLSIVRDDPPIEQPKVSQWDTPESPETRKSGKPDTFQVPQSLPLGGIYAPPGAVPHSSI